MSSADESQPTANNDNPAGHYWDTATIKSKMTVRDWCANSGAFDTRPPHLVFHKKGHRLTKVTADEGGHLGGAAEGRRGVQIAEGAAATGRRVQVLEAALLVQLAEALRVRRVCPGGEHQQKGDQPSEPHLFDWLGWLARVVLVLRSGHSSYLLMDTAAVALVAAANSIIGACVTSQRQRRCSRTPSIGSIGGGACPRPLGSTANVHRPVINCVN
jgi:hypothetical protein